METDSELVLLGIDTGGTFTDYVGVTGEGSMVKGKVNSTPEHPERAISRILDELSLSEECRLVHGTTVATNALLEDELAETVLITNSGLDGLLDIGRGIRPHLYDLNPDPDQVSPFDLDVVTVGLRDHPMDESTDTWDEKAKAEFRSSLRELDPDVAAVCLVHSYRDSTLENEVRKVLEEVDVDVVLSSEVLPRFREFERASSTAVNAGLKPVVSEYIDNLETLSSLPEDHYLMGSDRGVLQFEEASRRPVLTVLSGPAGGVIGSKDHLETESCERFISMDMGGTSTDVTAVEGSVPLTDEHEIGGYELAFPMVDVHTVGSGGGSVIWVDEAESLRVGPGSAGADPGPACYGNGGPATLTDAQICLGRIPTDRPLSDDLRLDSQSSRDALGTVGAPLDKNAIEVARGALRLARAKLVEAIRTITVRRGKNPGDYSLIAHGGAGGLFAAKLAEELHVSTVYVPREAGVASASGLLAAPQFAQRSVSPLAELKGGGRIPGLGELLKSAPTWSDDSTKLSFEAQCRFKGQTHTVGISFVQKNLDSAELSERFTSKYEEEFGYRPEEKRVELVNLDGFWRRTFEGKNRESKMASGSSSLPSRTVFTSSDQRNVEVFELESFDTEQPGPCLLSGSTTTIYVPPGWTVQSSSERLVKLTQ